VECQPCGAELSDGTLMCKNCTSKLGKDLISVSWLVREIEHRGGPLVHHPAALGCPGVRDGR